MLRIIWLVVASLLLSGSGIQGQSAQRQAHINLESVEMPNVLYSSHPDSTYPRWVSIEAAYLSPGELNPEYFSDVARRSIRTYWGLQPEAGCIRLQEHYVSDLGAPDQSTLIETLEHSNLAFQGRVTGKAYGFRGYEPGQLLRVEPVEVFRSTGSPLDVYFIFYPVGTFVIDGQPVCKTDVRYASEPEIGDQVFVAAPPFYYQDNADEFVDFGDAAGLITSREGRLSFPRRFLDSDKAVPFDQTILIELFRGLERGGN